MPKGARKGKSPELIKIDITTEDFYKNYIETNCEDKKSKFYINKTLYTKLVKGFFDEVVDKMIHENFEFKIPYRLGTMMIRSHPTRYKFVDGKQVNYLPPDWNATYDLWERDAEAKENKILVRHLNKHSDGHIYKYYYIRNKSTMKNRYFWWFKPTRNNKIKLKVAIESGNLNFYEI